MGGHAGSCGRVALTRPLTGSATAALTFVSVDAMAERTGEDLEQPVLEAVAELEDEKRHVSLHDVAERAELPTDQVAIGVRRLLPTDLLDGTELPGDKPYEARGLRLLPRGRQAVRQWPSADPAEAFLQALAQRIAVEPDPEQRGRLEKLRASTGEVGKGVLTGVVTALVQQVTGLS